MSEFRAVESIAMRRATDYLTQRLSPLRLKASQYRILLALSLSESPLSEFDIQCRLHIDPDQIHVLIIELKDRNFVEEHFGKWLGTTALGRAFFKAASELAAFGSPVLEFPHHPSEVMEFPALPTSAMKVVK
jgi:DNA-binding MarR family transcriptional regulator